MDGNCKGQYYDTPFSLSDLLSRNRSVEAVTDEVVQLARIGRDHVCGTGIGWPHRRWEVAAIIVVNVSGKEEAPRLIT